MKKFLYMKSIRVGREKTKFFQAQGHFFRLAKKTDLHKMFLTNRKNEKKDVCIIHKIIAL